MSDRSEPEALYSHGYELSYELDAMLERAKAAASGLPSADLRDREAAIQALLKKSEMARLVIHTDQAQTTTSLEDVVVPGPRGGPSGIWVGNDVMRPGVKVVVTVPFSGHSMLLRYKASPHQDLDATTGLLVGKIEFSKIFTMPTTAISIRKWRTTTLIAIRANAEAANAEAQAHYEKVSAALPTVLDKRQADQDALRQITAELG